MAVEVRCSAYVDLGVGQIAGSEQTHAGTSSIGQVQGLARASSGGGRCCLRADRASSGCTRTSEAGALHGEWSLLRCLLCGILHATCTGSRGQAQSVTIPKAYGDAPASHIVPGGQAEFRNRQVWCADDADLCGLKGVVTAVIEISMVSLRSA